MGFLLDFHGGSLEFLWGFTRMPMELLWGFYWISWWFFGISIGFHKNVYGIPIGFLFDFHGISMEFLRYSYGIPVGFLWES